MTFKPAIDDFALELIGTADVSFEKSIVEYEVPFADGAILDDMGAKARHFQIKTIWRRQNYEIYRDFLVHAGIEQLNTYIDPGLGIIHGRIKSANVTRDDRKCAEINIEFIEDANPDAVPAYAPPLVADMEEGFNEAAAALMDAAAADCVAAGVDPSVEIEPGAPIASLSVKTVSARAFMASMERSLNALQSSFNQALNPADSAVGMFDYGLSLPGRIVGTLAGAVERAALMVGTAGASPVAAVASLQKNIARLCTAIPALGNQIKIAGAAIGALITGRIFADDESKRAVTRRIEDTPQWRPDGTRISVPDTPPTSTANELEEALLRIRNMLYAGVTAARAIGSTQAVAALSAQAAALLKYVNTIKLERDRIVEVEAEDALPLHLICLRHGLPYSYADRICTINSFWNPTFCVGKVRVYERR